MGFNTLRVILRPLVTDAALAVLSMAFLAPAVLADGGDKSAQPERITATAAQTITLPYHFEVIDFSGATGPSLPTIDLSSVDFINTVGSIAVTIFSLLDQYAILGIFVLILAALGVVWWLFSVVSGRANNTTLNVSGGISAMSDAYYDAQNYSLEQENAAIEGSGALDQDSNRAGLGRATLALNKSLIKSNNAGSAKYKQAGRVFKKASKLKW